MKNNHNFIIILFIVASTCLISCGQSKHPKIDNQPKLWRYIDNPDAKDQECRTETARAKRDLQAGNLVFCSPFGFGSSHLRYEQELRMLSKTYGLKFGYELFSDVIVEHQTQGCYGAVMDRTIAAKFGNGFKKKLESRADSLFIVASQTSIVDYTECDVQPSLPDQPDRVPVFFVKVPYKLIAQPRPKEDDYGPFMDIMFIIEKSGEGHDFEIAAYIDAGKESDATENYKKELWAIALAELQRIPIWIPGIVQGKKVKTRATVRVHFEANE